jgi:hypothetical protein
VNRLLRALLVLALAAAPVAVPGPAAAAPGDPAATGSAGPQPVMLVVDTSGSMADDDGTGVAKILGAREALLDLLAVLPVDSHVGLRTYPGPSGGCDTGTLAFAPREREPERMAAEVHALAANGDTPTAEALEAAGNDLRTAGYTSATLVLVSDGLSTCGDPCPVAQQLAADGLAVTVNTVGFRIDEEGAEELRCIARATGGTYSDVTDSSALAEALATLNGPELSVRLTYPTTYSPSASPSLDVSVEIENLSSTQADDVRASIVFDPGASGGSPTVLRPVRVLGNLAGGATTKVAWQAFPSTVRSSGTLDFGVTVTRNGGPPVVGTGTVKLGGKLNVGAGGPLLQGVDHVVVLGDSYSSGEGAGVGISGYEYDFGKCHRSRYTYAAQLFADSRADVDNLACSGAVINNYTAKQNGTVAPQREQLKDQDDIDLMLLTMGGNDLNFSSIVLNCASGIDCWANRLTCLIDVFVADADCGNNEVANPMFWQKQLGDLRPQLEGFYRDVLHDSAERGGDRGAPPLVVLPYTYVLPASGMALGCQRGFPLLEPHEMALLRWLQDELNNQIAQAVAAVRTSTSRIYYADDVLHAVRPDHTLCGDERWINGLTDGEGQEKIHPNALGYAAEAAALLRWSTTVTEPEPADVQDGRNPIYRIGGGAIDLGADLLDSTVDGARDLWHDVQEIDLRVPRIISVTPGLSYRVSGGGFAPGETAVVSVASTPQALATAVADADGTITAEVQVPDDLPAGEHTLFATGFTPDGSMQLIGRPLDVSGPSLAGPLTLGAGALLLLLAGGLLLRVGRRRRRAGIALRDAGGLT